MKLSIRMFAAALMVSASAYGDIIEYRFTAAIEYAGIGPEIGLDDASLLFSFRIDREAAPVAFCTEPCAQFGLYRTLPGTATFVITNSNQLDGIYVDDRSYRLEIVHFSMITSDEFVLDSAIGLPIPGLEHDYLNFRVTYFLPLPFRSIIVPTELPLEEDNGGARGSFITHDGYWHYIFYPFHALEVLILPEPADFNQDHQNDMNDYALFAEYFCDWLCDDDDICNCESPVAFDPLADFDEDGDVDLRDVAGFQRSFTGIPIVGDFDNNRTVNLFDFGHFHESNCNWPCAYQFGGEPPCNDPALWESACDPPAVPHPRADIDKDGDSDFYDFALFQNAFGTGE